MSTQHGTYAGVQWHRRNKVPTCGPCKDAAAAYMRQRREENAAVLLSDINQVRAYNRALRRLRDMHREDFDLIYAQERGVIPTT